MNNGTKSLQTSKHLSLQLRSSSTIQTFDEGDF